MFSRAGHVEADVETGRRHKREEADVPEGSSPESRLEKAKNEFCISLEKMFSDAARVEQIMGDIALWEYGRQGLIYVPKQHDH